jgi:hypothetical protein
MRKRCDPIRHVRVSGAISSPAFQEAETERAAIVAQFQVTMEQKVQYDEAITPLMEEQSELNKRIRGFDNQKRELAVSFRTLVCVNAN